MPHPSPGDDVIDGAFVARAPDGREFALTVFRVKPDTASGAERTSTVSGYLRPKPN